MAFVIVLGKPIVKWMVCLGGWWGCNWGGGDNRVFVDGGKVVVLMVMMTNIRLAIAIRKK